MEVQDRRGLEKMLRYMGRPSLSEEHLKLAFDGRIIVEFKKAGRLFHQKREQTQATANHAVTAHIINILSSQKKDI